MSFKKVSFWYNILSHVCLFELTFNKKKGFDAKAYFTYLKKNSKSLI